MTRKQQHKAQCSKCRVDAVCPQCNQAVDSATPFSLWLRELEYPLNSMRCVAHDLDYIWHCYREDWFITLEEKRNFGKPSRSQENTHSIVTQLLSIASGCTIMLEGTTKQIEYRGHYVIQFQKDAPDNSDSLIINGSDYLGIFGDRAVKHLLNTGSLLNVSVEEQWKWKRDQDLLASGF